MLPLQCSIGGQGSEAAHVCVCVCVCVCVRVRACVCACACVVMSKPPCLTPARPWLTLETAEPLDMQNLAPFSAV